MGGRFPDITLAQVVAVLGSLFGLLVAFGIDVSQAKQDAIIDFIKILAPVLIASDAALRIGRNVGNKA